MQPVDFTKLIQDIRAKGGFEDYPAPLGPDLSVFNIDHPNRGALRNPIHMGDKAYRHGPDELKHSTIQIPQALIDAQHQSFRDALSTYMPTPVLMQFMCSYFQSDFFDNISFYELRSQWLPSIDTSRPRYKREPHAPWYQSFSIDGSKRKSLRRRYFTEIEVHVVQSICKKRPELLATTMAYQASVMSYFNHLQAVIEQDETLSGAERERALKIHGELKNPWSANNFSIELLPAICLAYFQRDPSLKSEPMADDFERGMRFALKIGLFQHHYPKSDGTVGEFKCPAMTTITTTSMGHAGDEACQRPAEGKKLGGLFAMIYGRVKQLGLPAHSDLEMADISHRQASVTLLLARAFPSRLLAYVVGA